MHLSIFCFLWKWRNTEEKTKFPWCFASSLQICKCTFSKNLNNFLEEIILIPISPRKYITILCSEMQKNNEKLFIWNSWILLLGKKQENTINKMIRFLMFRMVLADSRFYDSSVFIFFRVTRSFTFRIVLCRIILCSVENNLWWFILRSEDLG